MPRVPQLPLQPGDPAQAGNLAKLRAEITRLQRQLGDTGQFANEIPRDGVDAPVNVPRLGEKDVRGAIALARP